MKSKQFKLKTTTILTLAVLALQPLPMIFAASDAYATTATSTQQSLESAQLAYNKELAAIQAHKKTIQAAEESANLAREQRDRNGRESVQKLQDLDKDFQAFYAATEAKRDEIINAAEKRLRDDTLFSTEAFQKKTAPALSALEKSKTANLSTYNKAVTTANNTLTKAADTLKKSTDTANATLAAALQKAATARDTVLNSRTATQAAKNSANQKYAAAKLSAETAHKKSIDTASKTFDTAKKTHELALSKAETAKITADAKAQNTYNTAIKPAAAALEADKKKYTDLYNKTVITQEEIAKKAIDEAFAKLSAQIDTIHKNMDYYERRMSETREALTAAWDTYKNLDEAVRIAYENLQLAELRHAEEQHRLAEEQHRLAEESRLAEEKRKWEEEQNVAAAENSPATQADASNSSSTTSDPFDSGNTSNTDSTNNSGGIPTTPTDEPTNEPSTEPVTPEDQGDGSYGLDEDGDGFIDAYTGDPNDPTAPYCNVWGCDTLPPDYDWSSENSKDPFDDADTSNPYDPDGDGQVGLDYDGDGFIDAYQSADTYNPEIGPATSNTPGPDTIPLD